MYAHMGMKIEEWEDGQVNIGIAVCPTKPTAIAAAMANDGRKDLLMSNGAGNFVVIPKSAFIIRPPNQSQGGISVTYAHPRSGPSRFIIMLNPQDQGYQDLISCQQQQHNLPHIQNEDIIVTENNMDESSEGDETDRQNTSEKSDLETQTSEKVEKKIEEKVDHNVTSSKSESLKEKQQEQSTKSSRESRESISLTTPQDSNKEGATTPEQKATGSSAKEASIPTKRSGDMKRVSWVEDTEEFGDKKGSGKSSKENKKDSTRKSNGVGNGNNRNSPTKKQHGFGSGDVSTLTEEFYTKGSKRSGDRSRIPLIATSAGDNPTSCEYYRRQMLRECMYDPSTIADNWYGYSSIQKYAGQKVVKKIAAEQKRLEEDISNRRKTEIWILGNETDDLIMSPSAVPLRKRTTRLKPMQIVQ